MAECARSQALLATLHPFHSTQRTLGLAAHTCLVLLSADRSSQVARPPSQLSKENNSIHHSQTARAQFELRRVYQQQVIAAAQQSLVPSTESRMHRSVAAQWQHALAVPFFLSAHGGSVAASVVTASGQTPFTADFMPADSRSCICSLQDCSRTATSIMQHTTLAS